MASTKLRIVAVVILDVALLIVSLLHLPTVLDRPTAPFRCIAQNGQVVVDTVTHPRAAGSVLQGDRLVAWEGKGIAIPEVVEFLSDYKRIGNEVPLVYTRDGIEQQTVIRMVPYYPTPRFVLIMFFVGVVTWMVALIIAWKADRGLEAGVLHWTLISLSVTLLMTYGPISQASVMTYLIRSIIVLSYPSIAVLFFYFTLLYPRPKIRPGLRSTIVIFGPLALLVGALWYTGTQALRTQSTDWFEDYQVWYDVLHISLVVYTAAAVASIVHSIRRSTKEQERRQLAWIVLGVAVGVGPYLLLHVIPQILWSIYLIPEEYAAVFLLAIPFSFLISLLRDRLLNVQFMMSRNVLSIVLKGILALIFILVVLLSLSLVLPATAPFGEHLVLVTVALGIAFLLNPVRMRIQRIVDETLFAARVRFGQSMGQIGATLQQSLTPRQVFERLVEGLSSLVPADVLATYRYGGRGSALVLAESTSPSVPKSVRVTGSLIEEMVTRDVYGLRGALDPTRRDREQDEMECFGSTGFAVCVPIVSDNHELMGAILIKPRGGKDRLQEEEIDLLVSLAREASEVLGRLKLQEQLILGEEEKRQLQELSELKSDFVSYVSHELFTPLTSMTMFTEFLAERIPKRDLKGQEYLGIIRGEAGRLSRMVKTILNTSRFDSGTTVFHRADHDLVELTNSVIESMRYHLDMHRFAVTTTYSRRRLMIHADPEAVTLAISNLVSNAIKYSPRRKALTIRVRRHGAWGTCEVKDRGMGMAADALANIFKKFYRAPTLEAHSKGIGLGLALVKQVMDGHGGRVEVRSALNKGSSFTLWFPLLETGTNRGSATKRRPGPPSRTHRPSANHRRKS